MTHRVSALVSAAALLLSTSCRTAGVANSPSAQLLANEPSKGRNPKIVESSALDLGEISGVALRSDPNSRDGWEAILVGDASYAYFTQPLSQSGKPRGEGKRQGVGKLFNTDGPSQWEDIEVDNTGRLFILAENPPRIEVLAPDGKSIEHRIKLRFDQLGFDRNRDANSLGEGMLLLKNGHVLIAKEKAPSALIEFGPEGEDVVGINHGTVVNVMGKWKFDPQVKNFVPLKTWELDRTAIRYIADLSAIAVSDDGDVYVLSDQSRRIARIEGRLGSGENSVSIKKYWDMPDKIKKPEGMTFFADRLLITSDEPKGEKNLFLLDPLD